MIQTNRALARLAGAKTYQGRPCPHGHSGIRYTRSKECKECHRERKRYVKKPPKPRALAIRAGETTYVGKPCRRGHDGRRYTRNGSCVECVKVEKAQYDLNDYRRYLYQKTMADPVRGPMVRERQKLLRKKRWIRSDDSNAKAVWWNTYRLLYA